MSEIQQPIYNPENELSIIGSILCNNDRYYAEQLNPELFFDHENKSIFVSIEEMLTENSIVSPSSLTDYRQSKNIPPLHTVLNRAISYDQPLALYKQTLKHLRRDYALRKLQNLARTIPDLLIDHKSDPSKALDAIEQEIYQSMMENISKFMNMKQAVFAFYGHCEAQGRGEVGQSTGYRSIDRVIGSLKGGGLYIIAGRPAMGKTGIMLGLATAITGNKIPVGIVSLEMSTVELTQRMVASEAKINLYRILNLRKDDPLMPDIVSAASKISELPLLIDDTAGMTLGKIKRLAKLWVIKFGIKALFIDQLSHVRLSGKFFSKTDKIEEITRELKALSKELKIPIVLLCQINRGVETREDKRPTLSDLKDSGAIEQDADAVLLLYRDEYYNKEESVKPGILEVNIAKQRQGMTKTVELFYNKESQLIVDIPAHGEFL